MGVLIGSHCPDGHPCLRAAPQYNLWLYKTRIPFHCCSVVTPLTLSSSLELIELVKSSVIQPPPNQKHHERPYSSGIEIDHFPAIQVVLQVTRQLSLHSRSRPVVGAVSGCKHRPTQRRRRKGQRKRRRRPKIKDT